MPVSPGAALAPCPRAPHSMRAPSAIAISIAAVVLGACTSVHQARDAVRNTVERTISPQGIHYAIALADVERTSSSAPARFGESSMALLPTQAFDLEVGRAVQQHVHAVANGEVVGAGDTSRPAESSAMAGEVPRSNDGGVTPFLYQDSALVIGIYPTADALHFTLGNRTTHALRILWNDAAFVDVAGRSGRLMHVNAGREFGDRSATQPPTIVLRGATISDAVVPADNVQLIHIGEGRQARIAPLLPAPDASRAEIADRITELRRKYIGRSMALLLPLEIEGLRTEYLFTFVITDVSAQRP
ncbi:MAG: hypothetical protein M3081_14395 [Gemmatimonadota bacterium]|nr:hypothetical protein [Gemmatimonadota bacterium]